MARIEDRRDWGPELRWGESGTQDRWLRVGAGLRVAGSGSQYCGSLGMGVRNKDRWEQDIGLKMVGSGSQD